MAYEQMTADMVRRVAELTAELAAVRAQANDDKQELDQVREYAAALNARCISDTADAERYRWMEPRMFAADFDYGGDGVQALVFEMPVGFRASADCDDTIDAAMSAAPAVGAA